MSVLSDTAMLTAWERGRGASPHQRAFILLEAARPELGAAEMAGWSIGRRDGVLLEARRETFGNTMPCRVACPACAEELEFDAEVDALHPEARAGPVASGHVELEGVRVHFRVPTCADLEAALSTGAAESSLFETCVLDATSAESAVGVAALPAAVREAVSERMSELDPLADIRFELHCAACGHAWRSPFDIGAYLWREVEARVDRLLNEVHWLAAHYGWSESDVLAMSDARRRAYLERLGVL